MRAIHIACNENYNKVIQYLVDHDVELNYPDNKGWNPIHYLCFYPPNVQMIKLLLDKKVDLECRTLKGKKPIHFVAKPSTLSVLKLLENHVALVDNI